MIISTQGSEYIRDHDKFTEENKRLKWRLYKGDTKRLNVAGSSLRISQYGVIYIGPESIAPIVKLNLVSGPQ